MSDKYRDWIEAYVNRFPTPEHVRGRCKDAVEEMCKVFPELVATPGHTYGYYGKRAHWWCVDPDGNVVDPTAAQFDRIFVTYEPFKAGDEVRLGKCMECGEEIWGAIDAHVDRQFCEDACADRFARSM